MTLPPWAIPSLTGPFTGVVGTLAGFSVASAAFIANLSLARESPTFASIIGMPLVSFLILATSTMIYRSTPSATPVGECDPDSAAQRLSHLLGNTSYFLGLTVGWLALSPLLERWVCRRWPTPSSGCWSTATDRPGNTSSGMGTWPPRPTSRRSSLPLSWPGLQWPQSSGGQPPCIEASNNYTRGHHGYSCLPYQAPSRSNTAEPDERKGQRMIPRGAITLVALVATALALLLAPARALAQKTRDDVYVRVNGTVDLVAGESVDTLVAVDSEARVAGTVRDTLVLVNQTATVSGDVGREAIVVNGTLRLEPTAQIGGDVVLINGELSQADGAIIAGSVVERSGASIGAEFRRVTAAVSFIAWLGMTLLVVVVALGWAAVGGHQLSDIAGLLGARPGLAAVAAVIVWIAVPAVAFVAFVTVIGIPLGITLLVVVVPLLWGLGYVSTGTRLGFFLADLRRTPPDLAHPYLEAMLGVVIFQLIALVPIVGGIVVALAGLFGAGAIVVRAWRRIGASRNHPDRPPLDAAA
jgi:hypothetical protein